jgi:hypothetical protein
VSRVSVLSSRANENLVKDWHLFFKHDNVKSPMSLILLVTVRAERLTSLTPLFFFRKLFFCHTHFLIALMMEAARTSETLVTFYQTTGRYNPEDSHLRFTAVRTSKSYSWNIFSWIPHR